MRSLKGFFLKPQSEDGFTLLEVLLAVAILGTAYLAIMQNFSQSLRNIDRLTRNDESLFAGRQELERQFIADAFGEDVAGEIYAEGGKYAVISITDEKSGKLLTLCLKEL